MTDTARIGNPLRMSQGVVAAGAVELPDGNEVKQVHDRPEIGNGAPHMRAG